MVATDVAFFTPIVYCSMYYVFKEGVERYFD